MVCVGLKYALNFFYQSLKYITILHIYNTNTYVIYETIYYTKYGLLPYMVSLTKIAGWGRAHWRAKDYDELQK